MEKVMDFIEAVRLVEKAMSDHTLLTGQEAMRINEATAILAKEYLAVRDRIAAA